MRYKVVRLSSLLSKYGEGVISDKLATFQPAIESLNDSFLTEKSVMMDKMSECRTYIAYDADTFAILGFFSWDSGVWRYLMTVVFPILC